jgi:ABC-2 type transport system permease protein
MSTLSLARPRLGTRTGTAPRAAFGQIVRNEARLAMRRPIGLIGGAALPIGLLIIFSQLPAFKQTLPGLGGDSIFSVYVPVLMCFGLGMLALLGLPIPLVSYRELGVLRRLSTTPVPPSWLLAAQGIVQLGTAVIMSVAIIVISITVLGVPAPKSPAGLVLSFLLAAAALFAIGLLISAVARTSSAVNVIGRVTFFPLMFFAGLWRRCRRSRTRCRPGSRRRRHCWSWPRMRWSSASWPGASSDGSNRAIRLSSTRQIAPHDPPRAAGRTVTAPGQAGQVPGRRR